MLLLSAPGAFRREEPRPFQISPIRGYQAPYHHCREGVQLYVFVHIDADLHDGWKLLEPYSLATSFRMVSGFRRFKASQEFSIDFILRESQERGSSSVHKVNKLK